MEPIGEFDDPNARYFNIDIHLVVEKMALIAITFNLIWFYYLFYFIPDGAYDSESYNIAMVSLCLCILLLIAQQKQNQRLLTPFMVFYGCIIIMRIIYCIIIFIILFHKKYWIYYDQKYHPSSITAIRFRFFIHLCFNLLRVAFNTLFIHIVFTAYKFMDRQRFLHNDEYSPLIAV